MAKLISNLKGIRSSKIGTLFIFGIAVTLLLTGQLAIKYYPDFEGKNIPLGVIIKLVFLGASNFLTYGLLFSVIFTSTVTSSRKINTKSDFVWVIICGLSISLFASFLQPKLYSQELDLLYAVKLKAPEDSLTIEHGIFEGKLATMTLVELLELEKKSYSSAQNPEKRITDMLFWPLSTLVFYFFGTAFGSRLNGIPLSLKIAIILFLIIPIWYFANYYLNPILTIGTSKLILDKLIPELVLIGLTVLIIKVTNKHYHP